MTERASMSIVFGVGSYTGNVRRWLQRQPHYLGRAPVGAMFCIAVLSGWEIAGVLTVGRPIARLLPQDGSWGEITRLYLNPGLPHGTASEAIRAAIEECRRRGMKRLISYHDRTRHTGCIYKKAGMKKDGVTKPCTGKEWGSREASTNGARAESQGTPKRRWAIELSYATPPTPPSP